MKNTDQVTAHKMTTGEELSEIKKEIERLETLEKQQSDEKIKHEIEELQTGKSFINKHEQNYNEEVDIQAFKKDRAHLLQQCKGEGYVVYSNGEQLSIGESYADAIHTAWKKLRNVGSSDNPGPKISSAHQLSVFRIQKEEVDMKRVVVRQRVLRSPQPSPEE